MVKKYIDGESKAERKARKRNDKETLQEVVKVHSEPVVKNNDNRYVVCLKYGDKYGPEYVNKLHSMVKRHLTLPYEFVCFTERPQGIDPEIRIEKLDLIPGIQGWWYKPMFFNPDLPIKGNILFLDLDIIIFNNIDKLFTYKTNEFCIIRDFNRYIIRDYNKFNSSIFRLNNFNRTHSNVYQEFIKDPKVPMSRFHGDQDWIRFCIQKNYNYWPDEWIQSYKWEMRNRPKFDNKPRGQRDFAEKGDPVVKDATSVAVFHGDPNPHICKDQWVIDNWN